MASRHSLDTHCLQLAFDEALLFEPDSGGTGPVPPQRTPVPLYRVQLVREGSPLSGCSHINSPADAASLFAEHLHDRDREHFAILMLDVRNAPIGLHVVSVGTLEAALVAPREVFKAALLANAARIIAAHNHPSGDPVPSEPDRQVTKQLKAAGEILGIELLDHLILGAPGRFISLKERGMM